MNGPLLDPARRPPTAEAIAGEVRSGERPAADAVDHSLRAALASEDHINAFTHVDVERARERAAEIDTAVATGHVPGPLTGVPVAIKDLIDHAGRVTTCGSGFTVAPATETAPCIAALEAAGAVVVGRTGLHEFAFGFSSENPWFGPVRNPWDRDLSPGGSSGGSAAAVAAGVVPIALGTDTGGSIRVPAALCGVFGLKVTHGRGSIRGVFPLAASLDTVGPLGRTVADVAAAYVAIGGHDPLDPWSAPRSVTAPGDPADLGSLTVGVPHPWVDGLVTAAVADAFASALDAMEDAGVRIHHFEDDVLAPSAEIDASYSFEVAALHGERWRNDPDGYGPEVSARIAATLEVGGSEYLDALRWRRAVRHAAERALASCDALATPTVGALRKHIGVPTIEVGGADLPYRVPLSRFTALVNNTGLPALALPLAAGGRPPPSLQLIGPAWGEHRLLEIGAALEAADLAGAPDPPEWAG